MVFGSSVPTRCREILPQAPGASTPFAPLVFRMTACPEAPRSSEKPITRSILIERKALLGMSVEGLATEGANGLLLRVSDNVSNGNSNIRIAQKLLYKQCTLNLGGIHSIPSDRCPAAL